MPRLNFILSAAKESLLFSEEREACPARLGRRSAAPRRLKLFSWRTKHFHESEEGMLTLATVITVLGLVVLIAFLGNIGEAVVEKIEMQNDADAAAYSTALWMARGMNAVTTTNHLLGEITALCVLHEAFGGPELDAAATGGGWKSEDKHGDVRELNRQIRFLKDPAPVTQYSPYWPLTTAHNIDAELVNYAVEQMADENEEFKAGAMIYDAKLNLKRQLLAMLRLKSLANAGYFVPPWIGPFPVGVATAIAASAVHIYASMQIILIVKEWLIIGVIQRAALVMSPTKTNVLESALIPALVRYEDSIAKSTSGLGSAALQPRVEGALDSLDGRRGTELSTFPAPRDLKLPLAKEPDPQGGTPDWGTDPLTDTTLDPAYAQQLQKMKGKLNEASSKDDRPDNMQKAKDITEKIKDLQKEIEKEEEKKRAAAEKARQAEEEAKKENKPAPEATAEEKAAAAKSDRIIAENKREQMKLAEERAKYLKLIIVMDKQNTRPGDPGAEDERKDSGLDESEPKNNFPSDDTLRAQGENKDPDQLAADIDRLAGLESDITTMLQDSDSKLEGEEPQYLQTAQRQVQRELEILRREQELAQESKDSGKINSLEVMGEKNPSSKNLSQVKLNQEQEKHTQWMRASYPHIDALRAPLLGMMNSLFSKSRAANSYEVWSNRYSIIKPYQYRAGKKWTSAGLPNLSFGSSSSPGPQHMYVMKDTYRNNAGTKPRKGFEIWRTGVNPAEEYFTVIGFAYRSAHDGLFADILYKSAHPDGNLVISQAMVYNATLETLPNSDQPGSVQPDVSWDTLNWESPIRAPEYGNVSGAQGSMWPWQLFSSNNQPNSARKVKLNWQAKLVPVTETRAKPARTNSHVPSGVRKVLNRSKKNFDSLIQH